MGRRVKDGETFDNEAIFENPIAELLLLINDPTKMGSVVYNLQSLLNTINQVSEKWNHDTRRIINLVDDSLFVLKKTNTNNINYVNHSLDRIAHSPVFLFMETYTETLPRDNGFYLLETGKNVERILSLISVFRSTFNFKKIEKKKPF